MCVIILSPKKFPDEAVIRAASKCNKDGAGIAFLKDNKVKFSKGNLTADDILAFEKVSEPPYLIHFRLATQGGSKPELAHPFPVDIQDMDDLEGTAKMVLAHNGTWGEDKWRAFVVKSARQDAKTREFNMPKGPWSDSKAIAWLYSIYGAFFLEQLDEKVATLDPTHKLLYYGRGWTEEKDLGIWVSNTNWKKSYEEELKKTANESMVNVT